MLMNTEDIEEVIKDYIINELLNGNQDIKKDENLIIDGLVDSMGVARILSFIETHFDLTIPFEEVTLENFSSITSIINYVLTKKNERSI